MPGCLQTRSIHSSPTVEIEDVCCRPHDCGMGTEEFASRPGFAFVRSGVFVKRTGNKETIADVNHVVFFNTDRPFRVSHPVSGGDDCTAFTFDRQAFHEVVGPIAFGVAGDKEGSMPFEHGPSDAAACLTYQQLRRSRLTDDHNQLGADELSLTLLGDAARAAFRVRGARPPRVRPGTRAAHKKWVDGAKLFLGENYRAGPSLSDVAGAVHCSRYHLVRIFRRETGIPVHQYLTRLRLRHALDKLIDGASNLTDLALSVGFSSHSHFTDAFRAEFGLAPSRARSGSSTSQLRKMSTILEV